MDQNAITSNDFNGDKMVLVEDITQKPILKGNLMKDFRGDLIIVNGGDAPHKPASSGRIQTNRGEFYPSIINAEWIYVANTVRLVCRNGLAFG